ncbi:MAG: TRAFs-binding domain-containing protein, partial [Pseudomonadota bacterium]
MAWEDLPQNTEPLAVYEAAEDAIASGDQAAGHRKAAVLALARGGALDLALSRFDEYDLHKLVDDEDALALHGRLLKDKALAATGETRKRLMIDSADAYLRAFKLTGGSYSGINAASLFCMAGREADGLAMARRVLDVLETAPPKQDAETRYFKLATQAEALLLLKDKPSAKKALRAAIDQDPKNLTARATTLRQFDLIIAHRGDRTDWLNQFRPPSVCFFAGRMPDANGEFVGEDAIRIQISDCIEMKSLGVAYGALAAGADIVFAEAMLRAGGELNVVLPCDADAFVEASVAPYGPGWVSRFQACLAEASSVLHVTKDTSLTDDVAIDLAARFAMGKVVAEATRLTTHAIQVLISPRPGGMTSAFGSLWTGSGRGHESILITSKEPPKFEPTLPGDVRGDRQLGAMLFADLAGFGQLTDKQVLVAVENVMRPLAKVMISRQSNLVHAASWGDGLFAVFSDIRCAASAALEMQKEMRVIELTELGLPEKLSLRIGAHYGPVTLRGDPVTGHPTAYGSQVAVAARIEPLAVPGSILASEAFAAALFLSPKHDISTTYLGRRPLKGQ